MGRAIVAVVAGIVAAFVVILACESIGPFIVPVGRVPLWFATATVAFIVLSTWLASVTVSRRV